MLKSILLASAFVVSAPAFAQNVPQSMTTTPNMTQPQTTDPQMPAPATPPAETPAEPADAPADTATTQTDPAAPATTEPRPAAGASQIAQVVNSEFASYDKNANGDLDKAEFGAWMVALKTASDPATKAADPATQTWVGQAFAQADVDKSSAVNEAELTTFLSQGAE